MMRNALLVLVCLLCVSVQASSTNGPKVGDKPPLLQAATLLQNPPDTKLDAEHLQGKVVILEFWATWCGPCVAAIPHLNELSEQFKGEPVQFVAITAEQESVIKPFLSKRPINAWITLDTDRAMNKAYGITAIPHTVLIGKDGKIAGITHPGGLTARHIRDVLAGKPISLREPESGESVSARKDGAEKEAQPLFQVLIRPSAITNGSCGQGSGRLTARGYTVAEILPFAFDQSSVRIITNTALPTARYDFIVTQPQGASEDVSALLQQALRSAFGLAGKREPKETDVFLLKVREPDATGLKVSPTPAFSFRHGAGRIEGVGVPIPALVSALEKILNTPVFDETDLTNRYDISLQWETRTNETDSGVLKHLVREKLGLELVPERRVVEVVVVDQMRSDSGQK